MLCHTLPINLPLLCNVPGDSGCLTEDICDVNAQCVLLDNTYKCTCNFGYRGDGMICTSEYPVVIIMKPMLFQVSLKRKKSLFFLSDNTHNPLQYICKRFCFTDVNAGECTVVDGEAVCECSKGYAGIEGLCKGKKIVHVEHLHNESPCFQP